MAAIDYQRHTAALRALLGVESETPSDDPAPGYDGPAVWIGPASPEPLVNALAVALRGPDGQFDPAVPALASSVVAGRGPRWVTLSILGAQGEMRWFELTGVPQGGGVLILARETTVENRARLGLRASRDMFRDVALAAGGFGFEADAKGLLRWVGPGLPLGFSPEMLIGRPASDLVAPQSPDALDLFSSREPVDDLPAIGRSADQGPRALRVTVRPVVDASGAWRGVRGHVRDETEDLRHARRDRFSQDMVQAMRSAQGPSVLLRALAAATAQACGTASAWVFCAAPEASYAAVQADEPCETMRQIAARTIHDGVQFPSLFASTGRTGLALALRSQDQTQGALLIAEREGGEGVSRDAQEVLRLIAPMAAAVVAHARLTARVLSQASQDVLTGLLNQVGWLETVERKLKLGRAGAVVLAECDRFRAFGDGLGQAASDELLIEIGGRLRSLCGPNDICARLGEAVFALWLDGADAGAVDRKTAEIGEAFKIASRRMSLALAATPLIGVAMANADTKLREGEALTAQAMSELQGTRRRVRPRGVAQSCSKT